MNIVHIYNTLGKIHDLLEAIWMHTSVMLGFDPETPLGWPIGSQTLPNSNEYKFGHVWRHDVS